MAQKTAKKPVTKRKASPTQAAGKRPAKKATQLDKAVQRLEEQVIALRKERDQVAKDLKAAKARIATLEDAQTQAINRIDWVIDSLHNVSEGEE
jgi:hypothetical protein